MVKINDKWTHFLMIPLFLGAFTSSRALAYNFYDDTQKKQVAKDAKRWSLSDWMAQKKDNQLMDMWLMFNAPSPYEFYIGVDTASFKLLETQNNLLTESSFRNHRASFGAFASIIGLHGEYEVSNQESEQWKALLMLRLLGSSDQSTNFTLQYGLLHREVGTLNSETWNHQVGGGKINIYFLKSFALTGRYEFLFRALSEESQTPSFGSKVEAGAHLEYGVLRFYGFWFHEKLEQGSPNQTREMEGVQFGARVYF